MNFFQIWFSNCFVYYLRCCQSFLCFFFLSNSPFRSFWFIFSNVSSNPTASMAEFQFPLRFSLGWNLFIKFNSSAFLDSWRSILWLFLFDSGKWWFVKIKSTCILPKDFLFGRVPYPWFFAVHLKWIDFSANALPAFWFADAMCLEVQSIWFWASHFSRTSFFSQFLQDASLMSFVIRGAIFLRFGFRNCFFLSCVFPDLCYAFSLHWNLYFGHSDENPQFFHPIQSYQWLFFYHIFGIHICFLFVKCFFLSYIVYLPFLFFLLFCFRFFVDQCLLVNFPKIRDFFDQIFQVFFLFLVVSMEQSSDFWNQSRVLLWNWHFFCLW